jgi:hypothetical protein
MQGGLIMGLPSVASTNVPYASDAAGEPAFWTKCAEPRVRPFRIYYYCGGASAGGRLRKVRWSTWNSRRARGRGVTKVRVFGVRHCALFCFRSYRARVLLTEPQYCVNIGRWVYRRFSIRYRDNKARRKFVVRFACDGRFLTSA